LRLDDETVRRLKAAADAAGQPIEEYAATVIIEGLVADDDWAEDVRIAGECERSGVSSSVEEAMAHFETELMKQVAKNT